MLEVDYQTELADLFAQLPCEIRLPAGWSDFFEVRGVVPPVQDDMRRFVRHQFRGKAVLELTQTLPAIEREPSRYCVYTRDLSRQGVGFVHASQLYPGEQIQLWLPQRKMAVDVVRCNRVAASCYVVGGVFRGSR